MNFRDFWLSNISEKNPRFKALLFDVDGTVVSGRTALPGAENFLQYLRQSGTPFCFLTNDSDHSQAEKAVRIKFNALVSINGTAKRTILPVSGP